MILIKIILIVILSISVLVIGLSSKYKTSKHLFMMILYSFLVFLIIFPTFADTIAGWFSIQYGSDLMVYIAIAILAMLNAVNFSKIHHKGIITTKLIRELAIKDVKKT